MNQVSVNLSLEVSVNLNTLQLLITVPELTLSLNSLVLDLWTVTAFLIPVLGLPDRSAAFLCTGSSFS